MQSDGDPTSWTSLHAVDVLLKLNPEYTVDSATPMHQSSDLSDHVTLAGLQLELEHSAQAFALGHAFTKRS